MLAILVALALGAEPAGAQSASAAVATEPARLAAERGLVFLREDAVRWRKEKECSTCHHGTMTVWAMSEARARGFDVADDVFDETLQWTKDKVLARIDLPRDTRPGWSMVNTQAIYFALLARSLPEQKAVTGEELNRIASHLVRHQESDGAWAWSSAPPKNRPPPFFESDEMATLLTFAALKPHEPADPAEKSDIRDARAKALTWLGEHTTSDTTQILTVRLLVQTLIGEAPEARQKAVEALLARQQADGGWGQLVEAPSDAYATGQAIYVLRVAGMPVDDPAVQRGVKFLIATQKEDGSWPMVPRAHPEATPAKNIVPITYFGSAWGTLGLLRTAPR